jgi:hypothetical protein
MPIGWVTDVTKQSKSNAKADRSGLLLFTIFAVLYSIATWYLEAHR